MTRMKKITILAAALSVMNIFFETHATDLAQEATQGYGIQALRAIGSGAYLTKDALQYAGEGTLNWVVHPLYNAGSEIIKESWNDPKVAVGTLVALGTTGLLAKYFGIDKKLGNTAQWTKDQIAPNEKISDLLTTNIGKGINYTITAKMGVLVLRYSSQNNSVDDNNTGLVGQTLVEARIFMANEELKPNFIPEKSLIRYVLSSTDQNSKTITISGTVTIPGNITRILASKTITVTQLNNDPDWSNTAQIVYQTYIQEMFAQTLYARVSDIPEKPDGTGTCSCTITPSSITEKLLNKQNFATGALAGLANPLLKQLPNMLTSSITLTNYSTESMKPEFITWAKKYMSYNEQGHPTGLTLPWELKPEYFIQPLNTYTAQQPHLFGLLTSGKSKISYTLKNNTVLFGSHYLANAQGKIKKNYTYLTTSINPSNDLIEYRNSIKNIYDSMIEELDIIFSLPNKLQSLMDTDRNYSNNQQIAAYMRNYTRDLQQQSLINIQQRNNAQGNIINGYRHIEQTLQQIENGRIQAGNQPNLLAQTIINELGQLINLDPYNNLLQSVQSIGNITGELLGNIADFQTLKISNTLANSLRSIEKSAQEITQKLTDYLPASAQQQGAQPLVLTALKRTIESLAALINETSPFNITPSILELAGFMPTTLHNFMKIPDSLTTFIYKCNAHRNTNISALDEDYLSVIFDLYIAPIFT